VLPDARRSDIHEPLPAAIEIVKRHAFRMPSCGRFASRLLFESMGSLRLASLVSLTSLTLVAFGCGHRRHHHVSTACPEGLGWDGASCVPLAGAQQAQTVMEPRPQGAIVADAEWTCPGGSVVQGNGCVCPDGQSWIAEQCQAPAALAEVPVAEEPVAEEPVAEVSRRPQRHRSAWIPTPPAAPRPPQVNIDVSVNAVGRALQPSRQPSPAPRPAPQERPRAAPASPAPTVTHAACTHGMVRSGAACQCPQGTAWEGSACLVPCHPTQRREGKACVCPKDTRWDGSRCELWQECRGGQVHLGAACFCPSGTRWDGQRCSQLRR
jgi:hypothetical protein